MPADFVTGRQNNAILTHIVSPGCCGHAPFLGLLLNKDEDPVGKGTLSGPWTQVVLV